ncbi:hypothetical protein DU474_00450 [Campylobacter novaezeelandiae]|uniref:Uncharacterized protein n=1 Tax=Campylobacter novaezeelandiae TaxID=2267891 RepID=A0A4Q9JWF1_9BACT|nr:hypothetical protein DU474_00450 [Campylobacter novaezeelandiae]TBR82096.1 hypothetical protein DU473_02125 [Campylobacter novaezeelandiae]
MALSDFRNISSFFNCTFILSFRKNKENPLKIFYFTFFVFIVIGWVVVNYKVINYRINSHYLFLYFQ